MISDITPAARAISQECCLSWIAQVQMWAQYCLFLIGFANKNITNKNNRGTLVHLRATQHCLVSELNVLNESGESIIASKRDIWYILYIYIYIQDYSRHFGVKTIMAAILKDRSKPKCSKLGPFRIKDFEGYNWWTLWAPMILCADSLHDDGTSVLARDDDTQEHFKKQLFGPLRPSTLWSSH